MEIESLWVKAFELIGFPLAKKTTLSLLLTMLLLFLMTTAGAHMCGPNILENVEHLIFDST